MVYVVNIGSKSKENGRDVPKKIEKKENAYFK